MAKHCLVCSVIEMGILEISCVRDVRIRDILDSPITSLFSVANREDTASQLYEITSPHFKERDVSLTSTM